MCIVLNPREDGEEWMGSDFEGDSGGVLIIAQKKFTVKRKLPIDSTENLCYNLAVRIGHPWKSILQE